MAAKRFSFDKGGLVAMVPISVAHFSTRFNLLGFFILRAIPSTI